MAGGYPWRLYHGPAKRQLLPGLLLGFHAPNVCCRGDEPVMDGRYRRLRFSGVGDPGGQWVSQISGLQLILWGAWMLMGVLG